ncbi:DUF922 domain-containing Zn-dependent protease [Saccharospirillum sp. MSK14-1]|uniref:DUF922 domain-containing Zn-dependent protease n=1 Tax=Saccharospirillum sp. MSK14-1 TaxID=1897632 RepID=UPI0011B20893|nr:DUF922 domain-containing protein [Saccharospirillum sp. MSK14-1]
MSVVLLAFMSTAVWAQVHTELDWQPYPVRLAEGETLAEALDRSSPIRQRALVYHATTDWQVQWRFWWQNSDHGCVIERVRTDVTVQIQLPELVDGTAAQQAEFSDYREALRVHEEGHQQFALEAGEAIDRALQQLPPASNCRALEVDANALGHHILERVREREFDYDRRTNHGETQGAWME